MVQHQGLSEALGLIDAWVGQHGAPGVSAAVWMGGQIVARRAAGEAAEGMAATPSTLFPMASVTKPVAAATVMTLIDSGQLGLDEPVGRILPEFRAGPGSGAEGVDPELERLRPTITARQLLCHVSGLPEDLGPRESRYVDKVSLDVVVDQMCRLPLASAPGEALRYSNAGFAVLSRLAERVSGQSFWPLAQERVLGPLGLREIVPDPQGPTLGRVAVMRDSSHAGTDIETYNSAYWRGLALPWGGLYGTASDAARFAGSFLSGGSAALSPAAITQMTIDQTMGAPGGVESARAHWNPGRWGLGWEVKGEKRRHWTGELTSPRTFCHFGHAGTLLWADPAYDVALAVFANRAVPHMWAFILTNWARLSNAVVAAASRQSEI